MGDLPHAAVEALGRHAHDRDGGRRRPRGGDGRCERPARSRERPGGAGGRDAPLRATRCARGSPRQRARRSRRSGASRPTRGSSRSWSRPQGGHACCSSAAAASAAVAAVAPEKWDALGDVFDLRGTERGLPGPVATRFRLLPDAAPAFFRGCRWEIRRALVAFPARRRDRLGSVRRRRRACAADRWPGRVRGDRRGARRSFGRSRARRIDPRRRALSPARGCRCLARRLRRADATRALRGSRRPSSRQVRGVPAAAKIPDVQRPVRVRGIARSLRSPQAAARLRRRARAVQERRRVSRPPGGGVADLAARRCIVVGRGSQAPMIARALADSRPQVEYHAELPPDGRRRRDRPVASARPPVVAGRARAGGARGVRAGPQRHRNGWRRHPRHRDLGSRRACSCRLSTSDALVAAMKRMLEDRAFAARLGDAAHETYAAGIRRRPTSRMRTATSSTASLAGAR